MIEHEDARLSLLDLVVPGLGEPTRTAGLRAHAAACDACQEELADLQRVHDMLWAAGTVPRPDDGLRRRVLAATVPRPGDASADHWRHTAIALAVLATSLLAAAVVLIVTR